MRLKSLDQIFLILLFLLGGISTFMLFSREESTSKLEPLAFIVSEINTVKRKADLFDAWRDLKNGDTLHENDQVFTHDGSEVELEFHSGRKIQLLENSLLKISKEKESENLQLERGVIEANFKDSNKPLRVDLNGKPVILSASSGEIQLENNASGARIFVQSGELSISDGAQTSKLLANQSIVQSKDGKLGQIEDVIFLMQFPIKRWVAFFEENKELEFSWSINPKLSDMKKNRYLHEFKHELLISNTANFKDFESFKISENEFSAKLKIQNAGRKFWKIRSRDKLTNNEVIESQIGQFELISYQSVIVKNNDNIFTKVADRNLDVVLKFINPLLPWTSKTILKISDPDKKISEIELSPKNQEFRMRNLNLGRYEVIVQSHIVGPNKEERVLDSQPYTFQVVASEIPQIEMNNPMEEKIFNYKKSILNKMLSWRVVSGAGSFVIQVKLNGKNIFNSSTKEQFVDIPLSAEGTYIWKVIPVDAAGVTGKQHTGEINVKYPKKINSLPKSGEIIYLDAPDQEVNFKWERKRQASTYQFELSENPEFDTIVVSEQTAQNNFPTQVGKSGNFYWRVKIIDGDKVDYSEPVSVEIKPSPLPSRPIIEEELKLKIVPLEVKGQSGFINLRLKNHFINFFTKYVISTIYAAENQNPYKVEWNLVKKKNIKSYVVEIYQDREMKNMVFKEEFSQAVVLWKNPIPGIYYWRLAYRDLWDRVTEFSNLSKMTIESAEISNEVSSPPLPSEDLEIHLLTPAHRFVIENLNQLETPFQFKLSSDLDADKLNEKKKSSVLFSLDLEFSKPIIVKELDPGSRSFNLDCALLKKIWSESELSSNISNFYWRIVSEDVKSKRRQVTIDFEKTCVEFLSPEKKLPVIENESKASEEIVNTEKMLRNNLKIYYSPENHQLKTSAANYSAKASGVVFMSIGVSKELEWSETKILGAKGFITDLNISSGSAFNGEKISLINLKLLARFHKNFSTGLMYKSITHLNEVNQNRIQSQKAQVAGLLFRPDFQFKYFNLIGQVTVGNFLEYGLEIEIPWRKFSFGAYFQGYKAEKGNLKTDGSAIGLKSAFVFDL